MCLLGRAAVCAGGGGPPRGLLPRQISGRRVACCVGPGRCVCRWAAARPRDRHTRAWRLGVVDLEARPGPAATHRHRGLAPQAPRRPPIGRCSLSVRCRPGPATAHRHRGLALLPPTGTAAWPRRPRGGLQSGGAHCLCVVGQAPPPPTGTAAWPTTIPQHSRPALTPLIPAPTPNFACNSPATISNLEFRSLELQRFQTLLKIRPIELHATFA